MNHYRVIRLAHFSIRLLPQRLAILVTLTPLPYDCHGMVAYRRQPIHPDLLPVVVIDRWKQ